MQGVLRNIDLKVENLWRYAKYYPDFIPEEKRLSLQESFTNLMKTEYFSGLNILLKREDLSKTGSLKTRGLAYQLSLALNQGLDKFVLSTSGNAGITAAAYLKNLPVKLIVVTSEKIPKRKITALQQNCHRLLIADNPTHIANFISKKHGFFNLRPSRDENSIPGYYSLAFEIAEQTSSLDNIFIYSTSGSSFKGLYEGFKILLAEKVITKIPKMYAVHSKMVTTFHQNEVAEICQKTGGKILAINREQFNSENFDTSFEGRSTLHAIRLIQPRGLSVAVLTGSRFQELPEPKDNFIKINTLSEIDSFIKKM